MMDIPYQYFLVLMIMLVVYNASGQTDTVREQIDRDKDRFETIMEEETNKFPGTAKNFVHRYYLLAEELPSWFLRPEEYATAPDYFIGISDPGMDSVTAVSLASLRARSLVVLSGKAHIDNISDNFKVVNEGGDVYDVRTQYLDFSRLYKKSLVDTSAFNINNIFYTKYGEAIVLLSYDPGVSGLDTLSVSSEMMELSREYSYDIDNTVLCRMDLAYTPYDSAASTESHHFLLKSRDNHLHITSWFNGDSIHYPFHPYSYVGEGSEKKDSTRYQFYGIRMNQGLWNAYINLLFSRINYYNRNLESKVKTANDDYSMKNQGIIRTVSRNALRFRIQSMYLEDNELYMELELDNY